MVIIYTPMYLNQTHLQLNSIQIKRAVMQTLQTFSIDLANQANFNSLKNI